MSDNAHPFELSFDPEALREWGKLDNSVKQVFKKKLEKLLSGKETPSPRDNLRSLGPDFFKIKLRRIGYRLVYRYTRDRLTIYVIAVGRRDSSEVYKAAFGRMVVRGKATQFRK